MTNNPQPTNSDTLEEILQLHWMDGAKLSGGSYANEPSLDYKQALEALETLLLEELIGIYPPKGRYGAASEIHVKALIDEQRTRLTKLLNNQS